MLVSSPPPSSATTVSPSAPGEALPASTTAPVKSATNADAGAAASSEGVPSCSDAPLAQHRDPVAERGGLAEVVRHEQGGDAGLAHQLAELPARAGAGGGVQRGERLVEQQRARLAREGPSQRDTLALAAREAARMGVGQRARVEAVEELLGAGPALAPRDLAQPVGHVLPRAQVGEEGVVLEEEPAAPLLGGRHPPASVSSQTSSAQLTRPRSGVSNPATTRRSVVLPAPEGPARARQSPGRLERELETELAQRRRDSTRSIGERPRAVASLTATSRPRSHRPHGGQRERRRKSDPNWEKIASGAVCVTPWRLPANRSVAPNSPSARPQRARRPALSPVLATARPPRAKVRASEAPSVRDASSKRSSTAANEACACDVERARDEHQGEHHPAAR